MLLLIEIRVFHKAQWILRAVLTRELCNITPREQLLVSVYHLYGGSGGSVSTKREAEGVASCKVCQGAAGKKKTFIQVQL